jgi:hypothetical protein
VLTFGESSGDARTAVDPQTWRYVRLSMPAALPSAGNIEIELLRPVTWIEEAGAVPGADIVLALPEMGLVGLAHVAAVAPIPPLEAGQGRIVLATVGSLSEQVLVLRLANGEAIEPTVGHRLFSIDRHAWVAAGELRAGEQLATRSGPVRVSSILPKRTTEHVYNIEVETDHSYLVGDIGVLSHNENPCGAATSKVWQSVAERSAGGAASGAVSATIQGKDGAGIARQAAIGAGVSALGIGGQIFSDKSVSGRIAGGAINSGLSNITGQGLSGSTSVPSLIGAAGGRILFGVSTGGIKPSTFGQRLVLDIGGGAVSGLVGGSVKAAGH